MDTALLLFKLASLLSGVAFGYFGFKLFALGKAAPGTCFAAFGALVIAVTLLKGPAVHEPKDDRDPAWHPTNAEISRIIESSNKAPSIANPDSLRLDDGDTNAAPLDLEKLREQTLNPPKPADPGK